MNLSKRKYGPPAVGERCSYPQAGTIKRSALLFDRICVPDWRDPEEEIPAHLRIDLPGNEQKQETWDEVRDGFFEEYKNSKLGNSEMLNDVPGIMIADIERFVDEFQVRLWVEQFRLAGHIVTPVYNTEQSFSASYPSGKGIAYQAALENIPEIVEDGVTWEQVAEFRSDEDAIRKYRNLRLWLEDTLTSRSVNHARDQIAQKIEEYEWAIRKHGLMTATGALSTVLGWDGLMSVGAGLGIGGAIGGPLWSALTGALVITGKVSVWVAERLIEKETIQRSQDSAVALICDAKRLATK